MPGSAQPLSFQAAERESPPPPPAQVRVPSTTQLKAAGHAGGSGEPRSVFPVVSQSVVPGAAQVADSRAKRQIDAPVFSSARDDWNFVLASRDDLASSEATRPIAALRSGVEDSVSLMSLDDDDLQSFASKATSATSFKLVGVPQAPAKR
jgi:hypothetical protein